MPHLSEAAGVTSGPGDSWLVMRSLPGLTDGTDGVALMPAGGFAGAEPPDVGVGVGPGAGEGAGAGDGDGVGLGVGEGVGDGDGAGPVTVEPQVGVTLVGPLEPPVSTIASEDVPSVLPDASKATALIVWLPW